MTTASEQAPAVASAQPVPAGDPVQPVQARRGGGVRSVVRRLRLGARSRLRLLVALVLVVGGAVALALGWYGVSGQALVARQLPYLVSGGLLGVALVILAAVLFGADIVQRELGRLERVERLVEDLHGALLQSAEQVSGPAATAAPVATAGPVAAVAAPDDGVVAVPSGATYHRPTCTLVAGKAQAAPVTADERAARGLRPCRVCRPEDANHAVRAVRSA